VLVAPTCVDLEAEELAELQEGSQHPRKQAGTTGGQPKKKKTDKGEHT
jgi:hypothetical protein